MSFLPKYYADQGLPSWRKILSPVATHGLEGGYKILAFRALLQHCIMIVQSSTVEEETKTLFLPESYVVQ